MPSHDSSKPQAAAPLTLLFPCSGCAKELKTRAELAGKKVKCPHCGQIGLVPRLERTTPPPMPVWRILLPPIVLALILWATFGLKLRNLDHTGITRWDEVFHAIVAQNVMKHPFKPTLVDVPYLDYDPTVWGENHVWLHKPILPFWQVALSFAILGVNTFALRLPAAILSTGAAWLTYLIGKELFDRRAALVAATLQAVNPFLVKLIHGYQFADNVDVALLFWVEAGIYFLVCSLRNGSWRYVILAGVAQGLAFLCKSYLGFIVFGVALTAWLLPFLWLARREECRIGPLRLLGLLGATVLTIAPWQIFCMLSYPDEFWHEHDQVWRHLYTNVERWAAPWDRVAFDYMIAINGVFYTPILVAAIALFGKAVARRHAGLWLMYAWGWGVVLPHLFATTKTPSATLIGVPALLLLLGYLVSEASRGEGWPLAALTAILGVSICYPAVIRNPGHGFGGWRAFGDIMWQSRWVLYHVGAALLIAAAFASAWVLTRKLFAVLGGQESNIGGTAFVLGRIVRGAAVLFCFGVLGWLGYQTIDAAWRVTSADVNDPSSVEVGHFVRANLPDNAVLLCEKRSGYDQLTTMFYADRTCYLLDWRGSDELATRVEQAGGIPYVVSRRKLPMPAVFVSDKQGASVYRWQPAPAVK